MGVLPFLAHGETHRTGAHYRVVGNGLLWLMRHQKSDGDLSAGCPHQMYAHALATIALCEAYGMTMDTHIRDAARSAVQFIEAAQNRQTGGWRYHPGEEGDTSVVGWQIMALRSAQTAGLSVDASSMQWAGKFLDSVAKGYHGGEFCYQPNGETTPTMTAVGLLCRQYLGAKADDPLMIDGAKYLLAHLPEPSVHNLYYWYYATMVMHNIHDRSWDTWNRKMKRLLVETQNVDAHRCARGSWDPDGPTKDQWGSQGGRHMMTSLSTLTLEVYYRYLPLYTKNGPGDVPATATDKKGPAAKEIGTIPAVHAHRPRPVGNAPRGTCHPLVFLTILCYHKGCWARSDGSGLPHGCCSGSERVMRGPPCGSSRRIGPNSRWAGMTRLSVDTFLDLVRRSRLVEERPTGRRAVGTEAEGRPGAARPTPIWSPTV